MSRPGARRIPMYLALAAAVAALVVAALPMDPSAAPAMRTDPPSSHVVEPGLPSATTAHPVIGTNSGPNVGRPQAELLERSHPSQSLPVRGSTGLIDPLTGYAHEPAPMGIADFGVTGTGTGATAYEYSTPALVGTARVGSMSMTLSGSTSSTTIAFELNAVVVLHRGAANYTYWIQNGLHVTSATRYFTIGGAYVWNFSAPGAQFASGELRGNKSSQLSGGLYVFLPGCGVFAGQCSVLTWPGTLMGRVATTSVNGTPEVLYQYDLGKGWVTYDTVVFVRMTGATVEGFVVDGHQPTPINSRVFYDAEWVWVAAGGGSSGVDQGSNLTMSLDLWNGHNYQAVPGAWDFGGNTGETSSNVSVTLDPPSDGTALGARLASGSGSLGPLYSPENVGFLNVSSPVANGTLLVGGIPENFSGGMANLTLTPGLYTVSLEGYANATETVAIVGGSTYPLNLSGAGRTEFVESGLPSGTLWGVEVGVANATTNGTELTFNLPNGTYSVAYRPVPGFFWNASTPTSIDVPVSAPLELAFSTFTYTVPISESGLPSGTDWWVVVGGQLHRSSTPVVEVPAPNGSTPFTAGAPYEFEALAPVGSIVVTAGVATPVQVSFEYRPTYIVGTVDPGNASVTIGGIAQMVTGGTFNDSVTPGNYTLVASAPGFATKSIAVNAKAGNTTIEQVTLAPEKSRNPGTNTSGMAGFGVLPWIAVGIAAAAIVAAAALLLRRRTSRSN
ncbi:MAG TPA: thermopsin family protease [Thermoplasmata archaeon]|nr:thermopsin family protease [Thermoplasmata archaeon]